MSTEKELFEERVLSKLFREGSLYVTSDTDWDEVRDWESVLKPLVGDALCVLPVSYADIIDDIIRRNCRFVVGASTSYPATWEGYSSIDLYYCTKPQKTFVIRETHTDGDFSAVRFTVHKDIKSVVRDYNSAIDAWVDTLEDHARLEVSGAEESKKRAEVVKQFKIKVKDILEKIKDL